MKGEKIMGKFTFHKTPVEGVYVIEPTVFGDERGYFMETYQREEFAAGGIPFEFVQDNQSKSKKGVLRGLHFQTNRPQGKLVRVIRGEVYDVAVDIRPDSPTFGQYCGVALSEQNKKQFFIPAGLAHGFLVLSDTAEFVYKCTDYYDPTGEGGLLWNDPDLGIDWPITPDMEILLSEKDKAQQSFAAYRASVGK